MAVCDSSLVSADALPTVPFELTAAEAAAILVPIDFALRRIDKLRLSGVIGLNPAVPTEQVFAGRRFTEEMYGRLRSAADKLRSTDGTVSMDDFELRIAAFAYRSAHHVSPIALISIDLLDMIETVRKRAKRRAKDAFDAKAYQEVSEMWDGFRQWCRSYVFVSPKLSAARNVRNRDSKSAAAAKKAGRPIAELLKLAGDVINPESKFAADAEVVRKEMLDLLREIKRGRWAIDVEDLYSEPEVSRDTIAEFLLRHGHVRHLREQYMDPSTLQSSRAEKLRRGVVVADEDGVPLQARPPQPAMRNPQSKDDAVPAVKASAASPAAARKSTAAVIDDTRQASRSGVPDLVDRIHDLAEWFTAEIRLCDRLDVCNEILRRINWNKALPAPTNYLTLPECRPSDHRTGLLAFYVNWALTWLFSAGPDRKTALRVVREAYPEAHEIWIRMDTKEQESRLSEIDRRYFRETRAHS